jgi:hypothetical protein
MGNITKDQIKIIHTLIHKMKLSDDDYRAMLSGYGALSCKNLTFENAVYFISTLAKMAEQNGVYTKPQQHQPQRKYDKLGARNDYAYPAQLRKISYEWSQVSRMSTQADREKALSSFVKNKFGIDRIEWLPRNMVGKVLKSIQSIKV